MFPPETTHTTFPRPARPAVAAATEAAEGVHEGTLAARAAPGPERVEPLVVRHRDDAPAEPLDRGDLRGGCALWHDDGARDPEPLRVPGHALSHVARAGGPHALRQLVLRGERHAIARAADLERADR